MDILMGIYRCGKKATLSSIKQGETIEVAYISKIDYGSWRTTASHIYKLYGAYFSFRHNDSVICITRHF